MSTSRRVGFSSVRADLAWFRITIFGHFLLYLIPAITAWTSSLNGTAWIPLVALPLTLSVGVGLLVSRQWRGAGGRIIAGTVGAAIVDVVSTFVLVVLYSSANPEWDLS